jgi:hypothetical protein
VPVRPCSADRQYSRAGRAPAVDVGIGTVERTDAFAGGGSLPEERIASRALRSRGSASKKSHTPIVRSARSVKDLALLDMLTVSDDELPRSRRR